MVTTFISFSTKVSTKKLFNNFTFRRDRIDNKKLKKKLKESAEFLRDLIEQKAPQGRTDPISVDLGGTGGITLKQLISDLPISKSRTTKGGISIWANRLGNAQISIDLGRRKHRKIIWVNFGTGLFGPTKKPIKPKTKPFLVFRNKQGKIIRVRETKGQKGQFFIQRAVNQSKLIIASKIRSAIVR